jgi:hypothetical protein
MRRIKVLIEFLRIAITDKIEFGRNVITKMTGNANFLTPDVTLAQLTTATNTLESAYVASQGGGPAQTSAARLAEKAWDDLFRKQALYVERISSGNEAMILSSGLHASHEPLPALRPEFTAVHGELEGEVMLKHKGVHRAAWVWQYIANPIPTDGSQWIQAGISLQASFKVSGLVSGKKYWFRAAYITKTGQAAWCDPVCLLVL